MLPMIDQYSDEIAALCRAHQVKRLALFGSALREDFDSSKSDLDFLVEFDALAPNEHKAAYFGLLDGLTSIFLREVDLIEFQTVRNPFVRARILDRQETLYVAA